MSPRARHRRPTLLAGVALTALLLAGCGGGGSKSRGDVRDDVEEQLLAGAYTVDGEAPELSQGQAENAASCVADALFEGEDFSKDEREAAVSTNDGDEPDPELVLKVEELVAECVAAETDGAGDEEQSGGGADAGDEDEDEGRTTTTDG